MDFTQPIDITAVNEAKVKYGNLLQTVLMMSAAAVLKHCQAMPGITSALRVGMDDVGSVSKKYNGKFEGKGKVGAISPRTLEVWPIVAEMMDEPERYRKTYISDVPGDLRAKHPFELWLLQRGIDTASLDLYKALFIAERSEEAEDTAITDSFNGWGTIIEADKAASNISKEMGNLFNTGEFTVDDCGEQLMAMWRHMPETFRTMKSNVKLFISDDVANLYDDWRMKRGHIILGQTEEVKTEYLLGSGRRCEIVRLGNLPAGSHMAILTTKENMLYGFDKESDMNNMIAFNSGNPYLFTAAMKYVFGTEFNSIHKSEFCVNDQPLVKTASPTPGAETQSLYTGAETQSLYNENQE